MKKILLLTSLFSLSTTANSVTLYGGLGNFDAVNDTGVEAHGFEIELDDVTSTQVGGTYDYNHYGTPTITEDNSVAGHPKVFIRYQAKYDAATGQWSAFTTFPVNGLPATQGHQCTNPAVNQGCEHFAASSYPAASSMTYSWLVEDPAHPGTLVRAANSMVVATPNWVYTPAAAQQPAQVVAVMPAPVVVPVVVPPIVYPFGEPSFVKVIKTQAHNANNVVLEQLIGGDKDGDGQPDWANKEPQQVESEFYLLQPGNNQVKAAHNGKAEQVNNGDNITRRYEFYKYAGSPATIDGETHEAMCDEVGPDGLHGLRSNVGVTNANGDTQIVDCTREIVVGDYTGANMVGFEAAAALGLIDHVEDGQINNDYVARTLVFGGNTPYDVAVSGALPQGLGIDPVTGVLTGAPAEAGLFTFTVTSTDADNTVAAKTYTINILDENGQNVVDAPAVTSNVLTDGLESAAYYTTLTAVSGTAPYSWSVTPALPNGLTLSADGIISGNPAAGSAGTGIHTFIVTDQNGKSASKSLTLKIIAPPVIVTNALPNILVGAAVSLPIAVTTPNNDAYTITPANALPAGLTFNNATHAIAGKSTVISAANTPFSIGVTVTDTVTHLTASKTLSLVINDNPITFSPALPKGVVKTAYTTTSVAATGGYGAFTYKLTTGALPAGLSLSGSSISGTPTTAGTYSFTLTATDSLGVAKQFNASITINAATVVTPPTGNYTVADESINPTPISAVGSNYVMVGSKKLIWNSATNFGQNTSAGKITVFNASLIKLNITKVQWKGLLDKTTNTVLASKIEIN